MAAPSYVFTIAKVALMLGEDEALLEELALGMEPEDGRLFICDVDDDVSVTAFTPFGVKYLKELLDEFKSQRTRAPKSYFPRCSPHAYSTSRSTRPTTSTARLTDPLPGTIRCGRPRPACAGPSVCWA
jgi:hypothetical protein